MGDSSRRQLSSETSKIKWNIYAPTFTPRTPTFTSPPTETFRADEKKVEASKKFGDKSDTLSYSEALKLVKSKPVPGLLKLASNGLSVAHTDHLYDAHISKTEPDKATANTNTSNLHASPRKNKPSKSIPLGDFIFQQVSHKGKVKQPKGTQIISGIRVDEQAVKALSQPQKEVQKNIKQVTRVLQGNILDSSAPVLHKGKQRENQKKKYTKLKKVILNERQQRRQGTTTVSDDPTEQDREGAQSNEINGVEDPINIHDINDGIEDLTSIGRESPAKEAPLQVGHKKANITRFCDNVLSKILDEQVIAVIRELGRFQDRLHNEDPAKARMKKRLVYGLREVHKLLKVQRVKCVMMAPNIEVAGGEGGLDEMLADIVNMCRQDNVPYLFALTKSKLGYVTHKHTPVSAVGILNYQGADALYKSMLETMSQLKEDFQIASRSLAETNFSNTESL